LSVMLVELKISALCFSLSLHRFPGYLLAGLLGGGLAFTLDFVWLTVVAAVSCALCLPCLCRGEDTDGDGNCIEDFVRMVLYRSIIIGITNLLPDSS